MRSMMTCVALSPPRMTIRPAASTAVITEFATFCAAFLDGSSTFVTGQFVSYSGGWG